MVTDIPVDIQDAVVVPEHVASDRMRESGLGVDVNPDDTLGHRVSEILI